MRFQNYIKEIVMDRRSFLKIGSGSLAIGAIGVSSTASALINCGPYSYQGIQQCEAGIDSRLAFISARSQRNTQWCWAACIEMVFLYYGYNVSQETIVQQTWGGLVNNPGTPQQILMNLNRPWMDSTGRTFYVSGDTYSANHITAAQDLYNNRPLIIGTMGHAMVLTSLKYIRDQYGRGYVTEATVRDPWENKGKRSLSQEEWYSANFLTRIDVQGI